MIRIIGCGMAGLLCASMLSRHKPKVIEAQAALPNNHSAVLRFSSEKVADVLGIQFRKVKLIKTYLPWRNRIADALQYAKKCNGVSRSDRSIASDVFSADRWIAPPDLIARMAANADIEFGAKFATQEVNECDENTTISTIPMPNLMKLLEYDNEVDLPNFQFVHGANLRATITDCDAFVSLYIPDPSFMFNRISITGSELIAEYAFPNTSEQITEHLFAKGSIENELHAICKIMGFDRSRVKDFKAIPQKYAKIQPIDDDARKNFLHWATTNYNIYSLGRYATWRPGLQLDDLVQDIKKIEGWIMRGNKYDIARGQ